MLGDVDPWQRATHGHLLAPNGVERIYGSAVAVRVETGCRDCAICTGHAFTGIGRAATRGTIAVSTLGISKLFTRKCQTCGHVMAEHGITDRQGQQAAGANGQWKPGWYPDGGGLERWWTGTGWSENTRSLQILDAPPAEETAALTEGPASAGFDPAALGQLAELHRGGALTDEDFAAAKRRLLGI